MASFEKTFRLLLDADVKGAVTGLDGFTSAAKKAELATVSTGQATNKLGLTSSQMATVVSGAAITAGVAVAGFAVKSVEKFADLARSVETFSVVSGTTTQEASKLIGVATDFGVSADTLGLSVGRLGATLGKNVDALSQYGVSAVLAKDGTVDLEATMLSVVDAFNSSKSASDADALAKAAFGKGYQALIPLIVEGSDKIKASMEGVSGAEILSPEQVQQGKDFDVAMKQLKKSMTDVELTAGSKLAPAMVGVAQGLTTIVGPAAAVAAKAFDGLVYGIQRGATIITGGLFGDFVEQGKTELPTVISNVDDATAAMLLHARYVREAADGYGPLLIAFQLANKGLSDEESANLRLASAYRENSAGMIAAHEASLKLVDSSGFLIKRYEDELKAIDDARKAIDDETTAALNANGAKLASADADARVHDAMMKYNDALNGTPPKLADVTRAQDELTAAKKRYDDVSKFTPASDLDMERVGLRLDEARVRLAKLDATPRPKSRGEQGSELADPVGTAEAATQALFDHRQAILDVTDAQTAYDKALAGTTGTTEEQQQAFNDVAAAQTKLDDANKTTVTTLDVQRDAFLAVQTAINDAAAAHATEKETLATEAGLSWGVRDSLDAQIASLQTTEKTLRPGSALYNALAAHIGQLQGARDAADEATASLNIYNGIAGGGAAGYFDPTVNKTGPNQRNRFAVGTDRVPGMAGEAMLAVVHGGERITPAAMAGPWGASGGQTIVVNQYFTVDPAADRASVGRAIEEARQAFINSGGRRAS